MAPIANSEGDGILYEKINNALRFVDESPLVEYKRSETWDKLKFRVLKTALAMGNRRDGGLIIIGVDENGSRWDKNGVSEEDMKTYDADNIKSYIGSFASSYPSDEEQSCY